MGCWTSRQVDYETPTPRLNALEPRKLRPKVEDPLTAQRHVAALQKKVDAWLERPKPSLKKPKVA